MRNAVGDVLLGLIHVVFTIKALRPPTKGRLGALRVVVPAYFASLAAFQFIGGWMHVFRPAQHKLDAMWLSYLASGATAPCLYGCALSLDLLESWAACGGWLASCALYVAVAVLQLDLADVFDLPRTFHLTISKDWAARLATLPWMPSALRANSQQVAGRAPLTLVFDGRGYAATPIAHVFDKHYASVSDLVAPFPDWRTHSLAFLMLCFGVVANLFHMATCLSALRSTRHQRASRNALAHVFMTLALVTMPAAMLLGGVPAGIDWMHACAAPSMLLQAKSCLESLDDTSSSSSCASSSRGKGRLASTFFTLFHGASDDKPRVDASSSDIPSKKLQ